MVDVNRFIMPTMALMLKGNNLNNIFPEQKDIYKDSLARTANVVSNAVVKGALEGVGYSKDTAKKGAVAAGIAASLGVILHGKNNPLMVTGMVSSFIAANVAANKVVDRAFKDPKYNGVAKEVAGAAIIIASAQIIKQPPLKLYTRVKGGVLFQKLLEKGVESISSHLEKENDKKNKIEQAISR